MGPRFLRHLVSYLAQLPETDPLLTEAEWWIVPHVNPDGEARNRSWHGDDDVVYDVASYLANVVREAPGDDVEFGFPRHDHDADARPENCAVYDWWRSVPRPFALHASLHGMAFGAGPWFLIEPAWADRCARLKARCATRVASLGYQLHDSERRGEKGFNRLERGFSPRPDSVSMRRHFLELGDERTADSFRPSSMEAIRALGQAPLTLVSEMPLFITPDVGDVLGPPDPAAEAWRALVDRWRRTAATAPEEVRAQAAERGLRAMPVRDQMDLQWTLIVAGMEQLAYDDRS